MFAASEKSIFIPGVVKQPLHLFKLDTHSPNVMYVKT